MRFLKSFSKRFLRDLARLLPFIEEYDAVIGYRRARQDTWLRKLNTWGWKVVVRLALGYNGLAEAHRLGMNILKDIP